VGRPSRETVMSALFQALTSSVVTDFTADTAANNVELTNVSTTAGMFLGLPVFGGSINGPSYITSLSPLTLSNPPSASATGVSFITGFGTTGRRLKMWDDVAFQPALFTHEGDESTEYHGTILPKATWTTEIYIYSKGGEDPQAVPVTLLNNLLDAVQSVFQPDDPMRGVYTIGGLVDWCRLGKILKESGDMDGQAIAVMEVEIIVP
jgi:hypothetical protein